jgi:4-carboxymuconolactone decarboxylase
MSESAAERIEKGLEQLRKMLPPGRVEEVRKQWQQISPEFESLVLGVLAGEVWTRPGLDLRTRSLTTIAGLTALGRPRALALNIEMALQNGATRTEIQESILQMGFYGGFPCAWEALQIAHEVFQRLDQNSTDRSK